MTPWSDETLQLSVDQRDTAIVVTIAGAVSMTDASRMQEEMQRLADLPNRTIVLDMTHLHFMGAEGLDAILNGRHISEMKHGQIRLVNPTQEIRKVLELTRLVKLFPIYDSVESALQV